MDNQGYSAYFSKERLLLATFKLASENNAMLKVLIENVIEMRNSLSLIEANTEDDNTEEYERRIAQIKADTAIEVRQQLLEAVKSQESKSMRESFEWSWMNDPDTSFDPDNI